MKTREDAAKVLLDEGWTLDEITVVLHPAPLPSVQPWEIRPYPWWEIPNTYPWQPITWSGTTVNDTCSPHTITFNNDGSLSLSTESVDA